MTVDELDRLCQVFIDKKLYEEKSKNRLKEISAETKEAQAAVIAALEELDKRENQGSFGKVSLRQRTYYKAVDKEAVYAWLRERGEYETLSSINAKTLSAHVRPIIDEARDNEDYVWLPPGMEDATSETAYLKID